MKLIKLLPNEQIESKSGKIKRRKFGLFVCPACKQEFKRDFSNGENQVSCGAKECIPSKSYRHGFVGTQVYNSWALMKQRCDNPNEKSYKYYGAKGITYPEKWKTFKGFFEDMGGVIKDNMSIDRLDKTKGYSKENCQWLDFKENTEKDKCKQIAKIDEDGNIIKLYESAKEAAELENIKYPAAITKVARGERTAYKGTHWRYM